VAVPDETSEVPRHLNRALFLQPDGSSFSQDKLCLTPSEQNPEGWLLTPGTTITIVPSEGLRVAITVCLDVEFTSLWARLGKLDIDLVLVPAKTDMLSGYYRVFGCAKARAIEMQTVVCAVGAIGTPFGLSSSDTVVGGAAAFLPCETTLGLTGIAAALDPQPAANEVSPLLIARDLPVGACRRIRHGAAEAEVWPASWSADLVTITEAVAV
jgi:predicted amidohydrolase